LKFSLATERNFWWLGITATKTFDLGHRNINISWTVRPFRNQFCCQPVASATCLLSRSYGHRPLWPVDMAAGTLWLYILTTNVTCDHTSHLGRSRLDCGLCLGCQFFSGRFDTALPYRPLSPGPLAPAKSQQRWPLDDHADGSFYSAAPWCCRVLLLLLLLLPPPPPPRCRRRRRAAAAAAARVCVAWRARRQRDVRVAQ